MIGYYSGAIQVLGPSLWWKLISLELLFLFYVCLPHSLVCLTIRHNRFSSACKNLMVSKTKTFAKTLQKDFCRAAWHGGRAGGCHGSAISVPPPPPNQALLNSQYSISTFRWWQWSSGKLLLERAKNRILSQRFLVVHWWGLYDPNNFSSLGKTIFSFKAAHRYPYSDQDLEALS